MTTLIIITALILMWALGGWVGAIWCARGWRRQLSLGISKLRGEQVIVCTVMHDFLSAVQVEISDNVKSTVDAIMAQRPAAADVQAMKADLDVIALFMREHYQKEIELGYHANRALGQIVTGYLAREREWARSMQARGLAVGAVEVKA